MKVSEQEKLVTDFRNDICLFVEAGILDSYNEAKGQNYFITRQQREGLMAVQKLIDEKVEGKSQDKLGVSIMSGKGTGKDAMTSWVILWFMFCFPSPKIPCVSVSADQLSKVLWSELSKWMENAHPLIKGCLVLQTDKLFRKDVPDDIRGKKWFAYAKAANPKSSPDEQVETLAGQHEDYLLQVVDEGSGILNPVFEVLENNMTGFCNLMLIIFNPMHAKGYAVDTQYKNREDWVTLQWNSEDSEITNKEKHKKLARKYGIDSNPYRMNVLGLPPLFDSDSLINWDWIMDAVDRWIEIPPETPLVQAMDCGGGGDMSIIASRRGNKIGDFKRKKTDDSVELINWAGHYIDTTSPDCFRVDTIGLGWAVEGGLRSKKGAIVEAADVRRTADEPERFYNKRAEMYWNLREKFEKGTISIPDDEELKNQLSVIKYHPDKKGRTIIQEKHDIKKELGHSPDEADAVALLYYYGDEMLSRATAKKYHRSKPKHWQAA